MAHAHARRRAPSQLEEAAKSLAGAKPGDDGRVEVGRTQRGVAGQGGRFFLFFTGFPFPLGPLFSRQTVRYEVCSSYVNSIPQACPLLEKVGDACVGRTWLHAAGMLHRVRPQRGALSAPSVGCMAGGAGCDVDL